MNNRIFKAATVMLAVITATGSLGAQKAKKGAKKRGSFNVEAMLERANEALMEYDTEALDQILTEWEEQGDSESAELQSMRNRLLAMTNMLGRVERIAIVDSVTVDNAKLFDQYIISADAGILGGDPDLTSYTPAAGREVFYTEHDSLGFRRLMHAEILDDGTRQNATVVDLGFGPGSDIAYPFMMPDGATLYFAADTDGENALGGFDIYMTRRDEQGKWLEPTNVGMPYNSPGNDYLMVIDEATGIGLFATDRNAGDGQVTVYTYIPNETRVNYDADTEGITDLAFITDIAATQPEGGVAPRVTRSEHNAAAGMTGGASLLQFRLPMGNGKVYTQLSDFKSGNARRLMQEYLSEQEQFDKWIARLADLRAAYGKGDKSVRESILALEKKIVNDRRVLINRRNAVIRAENKR